MTEETKPAEDNKESEELKLLRDPVNVNYNLLKKLEDIKVILYHTREINLEILKLLSQVLVSQAPEEKEEKVGVFKKKN